MARSRSRAVLVVIAAGSVLALATVGAAAYPGVRGYSGKPYNGISATCTTSCHAPGGTPPVLTIAIASQVAAGSTNDVKVVVAGNKGRTSLNAAFTDGVRAVKGTNTDTPNPLAEPTEIAAVVPAPIGATGTYTFSFVAPSAGGTITMWVAGMAASGSGLGGDGVATTTRTIAVVAPPGDAGADARATIDAGAADAGTAARDAGAGAIVDEDDDGGGAGSGSLPRSPWTTATDDGGGCSSAGRGATSSLVGLAAVVAALLRVARRR